MRESPYPEIHDPFWTLSSSRLYQSSSPSSIFHFVVASISMAPASPESVSWNTPPVLARELKTLGRAHEGKKYS